MERIEVIERAAATLHLRARAERGGVLIERLCDALSVQLQRCASSDVMLGGAYSRLRLWVPEQPEFGGMIWLRDDLDDETRLFAIAHELGHFVLHRGEGINLRAACAQHEVDQQADPGDLRVEDRQVQEYTPRARRELEASAFAAELLAPRAEVRRVFTANSDTDAPGLAAHFGVSRVLAQHRLIDAVLALTRPSDYANMPSQEYTPDGAASQQPGELLARLDPWQQQAARAHGPALVVAGPGTGKTATLVGRVAYLIAERQIPPEQVLALTFSNRAAGEMRERLMGSGLPGERMPIMTIHAFAATLLREYASSVPRAPGEAELKPDFRILDEANAFLVMEELLGELPLRSYRSLGNPTAPLPTLLRDFSQARDALLTPAGYAALVDAMPPMPAVPPLPASPNDEEAGAEAPHARGAARRPRKPQPPDGTFTEEQIARARERAAAYAVWDQALRRRGLVDFGGLVQRAVELLRERPAVLADVRERYPQLLVDEFQDTNRAAAELLVLLAGEAGGGLWVVGDQNQSIYRFRGASPSNLPRLVAQYPHLHVLTLRRCYRAVPEIVRLGSAVAARMAELASQMPPADEQMSALREALRPLVLESVREDGAHPAIRRAETFANGAHERAGLAASIERAHAAGYAYRDQAILCRTHKQARQIAAVLAHEGVPVSQSGDFFERPEVKDALMLLYLAAGPDARGVLRADPLLLALGYPSPVGGELGATARYLASQRRALPAALRDRHALSQVPQLSPATRAGLAALGEVATDLRKSAAVGHTLAAFLLRPGGYAWRLARLADGLDTMGAPRELDLLPALERPAHAQQALAALGELERLARRFDGRWRSEPEFRARLSRAVTHRRPTRPAEPDTLAPAPNADVSGTAASTATHTAPAETASAVNCFLHYLRALRASNATVAVPAGEDDAVQVLTLHQSKGLEFPVVLLPGLAQGQFPASGHSRDEVCPPGFRESDAPSENEAEERCLFYVGLTRARDVIAFTRATSYSATSYSAPRTAERSVLLALLDDAPGWADAAPLLADEDHERALSVSGEIVQTEDESDDESDNDEEGMAPVGMTAGAPAVPQRSFRLHDLQQYLECPRRYKYATDYGLFDPTLDAVYRFHRYIRRGRKALRDVRAAAPAADWNAATTQLQGLWDDVGPAGHAYDAFYWQAAEAILRAEWQAITSPEGAARAEHVELAQPLHARLCECVVEVVADRLITGGTPTGDAAIATPTVLVRLHTGRPRESDKDDLTLPLYYLAYQQAYPDRAVRIILAYTGGTLDDRSGPGAQGADAEAGAWLDVTEQARKDAEKYLDPTRKQRSKLDKLDDVARGIAAARFAPRPEEQRCAACAYCYVCPADPDVAPASSAPAVTRASAPVTPSD